MGRRLVSFEATLQFRNFAHRRRRVQFAPRLVIQTSLIGFGRRVVRLDRRVGEPCDELLDVTYTLHTRDGRAESGVVPEVQVKTVTIMHVNNN